MKKIFLDWLIDKLGGFTVGEYLENKHRSYQFGAYMAYANMKVFADKMYGVTSDEWCRRMYEHITKQIQAFEESGEIMVEKLKIRPDAEHRKQTRKGNSAENNK